MSHIGMHFNVDQTEVGSNTLTIETRVVGSKPYVLIQFDTDENGDLVLTTDVGGEMTSLHALGSLTKMVGEALAKHGETGRAAAEETGEDFVLRDKVGGLSAS